MSIKKETLEALLDRVQAIIDENPTSREMADLLEGLKLATQATSYPELKDKQNDALDVLLEKAKTLLQGELDPTSYAYLGKALDNYTIKSIDGKSFALSDLTSPMGGIYDEVNDVWHQLGHDVPVVQSQRRRVVCTGNPNFGGTIYRYLDASDSSKFEDGTDATPYIAGGALDGSQSTYQVYVETPKFYRIKKKIGGLLYLAVGIAPFTITTMPGEVIQSETHEEFRKSGWTKGEDGTDSANEYDYSFKSAFEGIYYDDSEATQKTLSNGNLQENGVIIDPANDKILSVANLSLLLQPVVYITRANARTLIANANSKQWSWWNYDSSRLLYLCEYKNWNSQSTIGGYTEGGSFSYGKVAPTGTTLSLGNKTGAILNNGSVIPTIGGVSTSAIIGMSYRGEENIFGNIWKWCDGINVSNQTAYICDIDDTFVDDTFTGDYIQLGVRMPTLSGYQAKVQENLLPEEIGSSSIKDITDYYYQSSGNRVVMLGGYLSRGSIAGLSCLLCDVSSSTVSAVVGSR